MKNLPFQRRFERTVTAVLMILGVAAVAMAGGCKGSAVVVAGSGEESDAQVQEHNRQVMKHVEEVDKNANLTAEQKAQVKHDLLADGIIHGGKKN